MEDYEEGACHCAEGEEALCEVRDALLDDVVHDAAGVAFVGLVVGVGYGARYAERGRVEGGLRDEAVGEGDPEQAGDASGETEEEDVPVEACRFAEGELGALGDE